MKRSLKLGLSCLGLMFLIAVGAQSAKASLGFTIGNSSQSFAIGQGGTQSSSVKIINNSDQPSRYTIDCISINQNDGKVFLIDNDNCNWLAVANPFIDIEAESEGKVTFSLSVSKKAAPGNYYLGLKVQQAKVETLPLVIPLKIEVQGTQIAGEVATSKKDSISVAGVIDEDENQAGDGYVQIENSGGYVVSVRPAKPFFITADSAIEIYYANDGENPGELAGVITVYDLFGRNLKSVPFEQTVFPGNDAINVEIFSAKNLRWYELPPIGYYRIGVDTDGRTGAGAHRTGIWLFPLKTVVVLLLALVLMILAGRLSWHYLQFGHVRKRILVFTNLFLALFFFIFSINTILFSRFNADGVSVSLTAKVPTMLGYEYYPENDLIEIKVNNKSGYILFDRFGVVYRARQGVNQDLYNFENSILKPTEYYLMSGF